MAEKKRRVLSIQSHVVAGYVGNKSATFPLQVLGFEVDAINSVQFSNHTGYELVKGQVLQQQELGNDRVQMLASMVILILNHSATVEVFAGLETNDLLKHYSHLLTGYIGNASFLREVAQIIQKLRLKNSKLIYVCDPVMGDDGRMYVPEELLPIFRDEIIPLADIVTPNQYEVELLSGAQVRNEADVWRAVQWFHDKGVEIVAISSSDLGKPDMLRAFLSKRNGPRYALDIPKQGGSKLSTFTGTGDLFAALFLAHSAQNPTDYGTAFERTIATLQAVIARTIAGMPEDVRSGKRAITAHERELKIVQSKVDFENPLVILKAEYIS